MSACDRRRLLELLSMGGMFLTAGPALAQPRFITPPFQLGVASGDPAPDGFVIWTRLAPEPLAPHGGMIMAPVAVAWEVAADEAFRHVVRRGEAIARPELAHAVHVELAGLEPGRPYWYRFICGAERSLPGMSRTLPAAGARVDRVRFAVAGCQHFEEGWYTAWRHIAEEQADFVFHYGDYIYEGRDTGGTRLMNGRIFDPVRRHTGQEIYSLDDYRLRYAQYRADTDLQAAHASAPWFVSFDDHEVDNNWVADLDQDGTPPEIFLLRRAAAFQAFYEHMPLRRASLPRGGGMRMFRRAQFGDLMQAHFLDTRQYRSDQPNGDGDKPLAREVFAANRTMLGAEQEAWLFDGLARRETRWNLIAQQVMMMHLNTQRDPLQSEGVYPMDTWSGYLHSRRRLLDHIHDRGLTNVAVVTGDAHQHYAADLHLDQGGAPVASEFLATSITSGSDGLGETPFNALWRRNNPHLKAMQDRRGYVLCDVRRDLFCADMKILDQVREPGGRLSTHARFVLERGERGLKSA